MNRWMLRPKRFKTEYAPRWSLWIQVILISLCCSACAARRTIVDWSPLEQSKPVTTYRSCEARGWLRLNDTQESFRTDFKMRFSNQIKQEALAMALLNPFGQTSGRMVISKNPTLGTTTLDGSEEILHHPLFAEMKLIDWSEELRFVFGLPLRGKNSQILWSPSTGQQKLVRPDGRQWICEFKDSKPHECSVNSNWGRAELNFTSVQCME